MRAILHEPGRYVLVDDFDAVRAPVRALVQEAMGAGGPGCRGRALLVLCGRGKRAWSGSRPRFVNRLRATAGTLFAVELGMHELYMPDDETLAATSAPVRPLVSQDSLPFLAEIAGRLGQRLGVDVATTPGAHDAYHEYPEEFAAAMRPFLRNVSE